MKIIIQALAALCLCVFSTTGARAQLIYADSLVSSSNDFQFPERIVDTNRTNYTYLSNLAGVLASSELRVRFPQPGKAGDAVTFSVSGTGQILGANLLGGTVIRLYDSSGNMVAMSGGPNLLQLNLLVSGSNVYGLRMVTDIHEDFKFIEARITFANVLSVNVLNQFRVYNAFITEACPPIYATSVYSYKSGGLITSYVNNPNNAADQNPNNFATMVVPLNLLGLLPSAYLDLEFEDLGRAGDYVGFTLSEANTLLDVGLLQNLEIRVYDENNVLRQTRSNFNIAELKLIAGTNRYALGFTSQAGNYNIARLRISMEAVIGLFQNLNIYNAFHYAIDRPNVTVIPNGPVAFCQGGSVTLTAYDSLGATNYLWSTGATTASINVTQPGVYSVQVLDSINCTRFSIPVEVSVAPNPNAAITGDTVLCQAGSGTLNTTAGYANYQWSTSATGNTTTISGPGKYWVTVIDSLGCAASDTVEVVINNIQVAATVTNSNCSDDASGSIDLNATGGSGSYLYQWSNSGNGDQITGLAPGLYLSTVSDSVYGCSVSNSYTVTANTNLNTRTSVVNTTSCGAADGRITLQVIGGSGNYTYSWSNGKTTASIDSLTAGVYTVQITDNSSGCNYTDQVAVSDGGENPFTAVLTPTAPSACNANDGSVSVNITGGSSSFSYLWSDNSTAAQLSNVEAGNYFVVVTDNNTQCRMVFEVVVPEGELQLTANSTDATCGMADGSLSVSVTGSSSTYNYAWSNGATTATVQNLSAGLYQVMVTDQTTGCSGTEVFAVNETGGPAATLQVAHPACATNGGGTITVTAAGSNNVYHWSNGSTQQNQSNLKPGSYTVTITDTVNGCSASYVARLDAKEQIELSAFPKPNTSCFSAPNGSIHVNIKNGQPPFTYSWSNNANTQNLNNLNAGTYTLNVSDANGCQNSITVPLQTDSAALLNVSVAGILNATCANTANGSATVQVTGGQTPYVFNWSNGANTQNLNNVLPGTYTLTVTDALGCTKQLSVTIATLNANPLVVTVDSMHAAGCTGSATGAIFITASGGTLPYSYSWSNSVNTEDLTNVPAGTYSVTVTDANGCAVMDTATVPVLTSGTVTVTVDSVTEASCQASLDGSVYVTASGGMAPYTFSWSNGANTQNLQNVAPGTYIVTAMDANGCPAQATAQVAVGNVNVLTVTLDSSRGAGCATGTSAAIYTTTTGGTAPYTYSWTNNATSADLINITPGTYSVTVVDAKGCSASLSTTVGVDPAVSLVVAVDSVVGAGCSGSSSGSIYVNVTKGVAPYSFNWSNGAHTQNITDVPPGTYTLTVTDAAGCTQTITQAIAVDPSKAITVTVDSVSGPGCASNPSGAVYTSVTGGKAPFTYSWSNGGNTKDLVGIPAGSYVLTVTDANQCVAQVSVNVLVDSTKSVNITSSTITHAGCASNPSGEVSVVVSGGSAPYTYNWSNGGNTASITGLVPGTYNLTVTDATGCSAQFTAVVGVDTANALAVAITSVEDAKCQGSLSGGINITVSGGASPYNYLWSNGATSEDLSQVVAGSYTVNVTDSRGCTAQASASIGVSAVDPIDVVVDSVLAVGCNDDSSGAVFVSVLGGAAPYVYQWSNGATTEDLMNLPIGSYTVNVTDDYGCKASVSATVENQTPLVVGATVNDVKCFGADDGSIRLDIQGGRGLYQYTWSNNQSTAEITNLGPGTYHVNVEDVQTGCVAADSFTLVSPDKLNVVGTVTSDACTDQPDGAIELTVSGGTPDYRFSWSHGSIQPSVDQLSEGEYTVKVSDKNDCEVDTTFIVTKDSCNYDLNVFTAITPNGDGANDFWVIEGLEYYPNHIIQVFNKWGDKVFETRNYSNNWYGIDNQTGNPLPDGTYFYLIKLNDANRAGGKSEFTGSILIQR